MTEEIIIDGVNVTGCCFLFKFRGFDEYNEEYTEWSCNIGGFSCENRDNCYYKQLKRLEQENKELKHRNENLRIALSTYEMPEVVKVLTDWRTGELQLQENKLNAYRSALEEIRELAEKSIKISYNLEVNSMLYDIKDKINEVLK